MTIRNLPVIAINLARRFARRTAHWWSVGARESRGITRRARRAAEQVGGAGGALATASQASVRAGIRASRRLDRFGEHVVTPIREERAVLRRIERIASGRAPIVLGPWISEVGYEVLYWVPFLRWFQDRYGIHPDRLMAVSRGGPSWWYAGIAARYVDVLSLYGSVQFAEQAAARRTAGDQKQGEPSQWERQIVADVCRRTGVSRPNVLSPGLMYRLFRHVWHGDRSLDFLLRHTEFPQLSAPRAPDDDWLPSTFAAVKFYTGPALPDTPDTRAQLRTCVARLSERMPIVTLDTGLGLDEHRDYLFGDVPGVLDLRGRMTPETNLGVQSRVVARASLFVGTCGSLAWLAPMLGVPTVGLYADDRHLSGHLYVARYAYRRMKAARFSAIDLAALAQVA